MSSWVVAFLSHFLPFTSAILLVLGMFAATPLYAQGRIPLTTRMARSIRRIEPTWRYTWGWCTCPPTVPGQVWRDIGTWQRTDKQGHREFVDVWIVKASSAEESADWIRRVGRRGSEQTCLMGSYQLGDEAFLLKCAATYKSILNYRKGPFMVQVRSDSQEIVERFARYVVVLPTN